MCVYKKWRSNFTTLNKVINVYRLLLRYMIVDVSAVFTPKDLGHFWLGYLRTQLETDVSLTTFWQTRNGKTFKYLPIIWIVSHINRSVHQRTMLIPEMLQLLFGYRHYAHRKCPSSLEMMEH